MLLRFARDKRSSLFSPERQERRKKFFLNRYPDFKVFADLIAEIVVVEVIAAADVIKLFTAVIYKCSQ